MPDPANTLRVITTVSVFGLVLALEVLVLLAWSLAKAQRTQRIERRLGLQAAAAAGKVRQLRLWHDGQEAITLVPGVSRRASLMRGLERLRRDAGVQMPASTLLLAVLGGSLLAAAIAMVLVKSWMLAVVCAVAVPMVVHMFLVHRGTQRYSLMDRQLVDGMLLASRSLRAGHPLIAAFRLISDEIPAPVGAIFGKICQQQQLGVSLEEAVRESAEGSGHDDLKLFATSVTIQLRSGGNLADTIERLASVVSDRIRLGRRVRVLTAQTQLSKRLLLALPLVMFVVLTAIKPQYIERLHATDDGRVLLAVAAAGLVIGAWSMNRLAKIKY
jgi:tight adherence protein B